MWAGIMAAITLISQLLQLFNKVWDALREKDLEKKKLQTEALQSGVRAIVDKDVSRLNSAINDLNRLRK